MTRLWNLPPRRRVLGLLALLAAVALLVGACADDADDEADDVAADPADETDEEEEEDEEEPAEEEESEAGPLEGEAIEFVQGHSADGGFGQYVMLYEDCLAEELGASSVTHVNEPGAGSLIAVNNTYRSEPDGTRIQLVQGPGVVGAILSGEDGVEFDLQEFTQLGRVTAEPRIATVGPHLSEYENDPLGLIEDDPGLRWAASGPGAASWIDAILVSEALGIDYELVPGFDGTSDAIVSVVAEETNAHVASLTVVPHIEEGDLIPWVQAFSQPHEDVPDTPTTLEVVEELGLGDEARAIAETQIAMAESGRLVMGPPGMDDEVAGAITDALRACSEDPDFAAHAAEQGRPIIWAEPEEMEAFIATLMDAPQAVVDALADGDD